MNDQTIAAMISAKLEVEQLARTGHRESAR
jgi:hypothetical protein